MPGCLIISIGVFVPSVFETSTRMMSPCPSELKFLSVLQTVLYFLVKSVKSKFKSMQNIRMDTLSNWSAFRKELLDDTKDLKGVYPNRSAECHRRMLHNI